MASPLSAEQLSVLCAEIDQELRALVAARGSGQLTEPQFVDAILRVEKERAARHGLTLSASHTFDDWTVIRVTLPGCTDPCASFEFQPTTGHYRVLGTACRGRDPRAPREKPET